MAQPCGVALSCHAIPLAPTPYYSVLLCILLYSSRSPLYIAATPGITSCGTAYIICERLMSDVSGRVKAMRNRRLSVSYLNTGR